MITAEIVKQRLNYDPRTGVFTWKTGRYKGKTAGAKHEFANQIRIGGRDGGKITCKRAAWLLMVGELPSGGHKLMSKDGDPFNDKWENITMQYSGMRDISKASVVSNPRFVNQSIHRNNKTGFRGVSMHKQTGRYRAYITSAGKQYPLGYYNTPEEASIAVTTARHKLIAIRDASR